MIQNIDQGRVLPRGAVRFVGGGFTVLWLVALSGGPAFAAGTDDSHFEGKHYRGRGDVEYLRLLETARLAFWICWPRSSTGLDSLGTT